MINKKGISFMFVLFFLHYSFHIIVLYISYLLLMVCFIYNNMEKIYFRNIIIMYVLMLKLYKEEKKNKVTYKIFSISFLIIKFKNIFN